MPRPKPTREELAETWRERRDTRDLLFQVLMKADSLDARLTVLLDRYVAELHVTR